MRRVDPLAWADHVDAPELVRGASTGFTVLALGGLAAPVAAGFVPALGMVWLPLVAVVAFAVAGARIGAAPRPPLHGAVAALSAYLLVLPLVLLGGGGRLGQILATAATALFVGAVAGWSRARFSRSARRA